MARCFQFRSLFRCCLLLILGCFSQAADGEVESLRVAVLDPLAVENSCDCVKGFAQRNYSALAGYLETELKRPVRLAFGFTIASTSKKLGAPPHLIVGKTSLVAFQCKEAGLLIRPIARLTDSKGSTTFQGLFVVRSGDPAKTLGDLSGRRILFGESSDEEKHAAALRALEAAGVKPPQQPETRSACAQLAGEVLDEKADAAVISDYALALLVGCQTMEKDALRILGKTESVPFVSVFASSQLPPNEDPAITAALLAVRAQPELCRQLESRDGFVSWKSEETATSCQEQSRLLREPPAKSWTDWRAGPRREAFTAELSRPVAKKPVVIWRRSLDGQSLGGIAATGERVIVSDKSTDETKDVWRCFSAASGNEIWRLQYRANREMDYTSAPRACPVIVGDRVFLLGALGHLHCVSLVDGSIRWKVNLAELGGELPVWGFCGTPLVVGPWVVVQTASPEAALVALSQEDGKTAWKTPGRPPGYGSLLLADLGGRRQIVGLDSKNLCGWDAVTGCRLWEVEPENANDFNVPTPVLVDGRLLVTTENNGARLFGFAEGGRIDPIPIASNPELNPTIPTPVCAGRWIWGTTDEGLVVLDPARQLQTIWRNSEPALRDYCSLIAGSGVVLATSRKGSLLFLTVPETSGSQPVVVARWSVFVEEKGREPDLWAHPAVANNRLLLRSADELVCLALSDF